MTRDETVALFLECEAKRTAAQAAALAGGKDEYDARKIAHKAAKAHWNAWAKNLLAQREILEKEEGRWESATSADFSSCLFLVGEKGTKETAAAEEEKENRSGDPPIKSIQLEGNRADFSGCIFPGRASFESATFTGEALFESVTFTGDANFGDATFTGVAYFESATFTGFAYFASASLTKDANFENATFTVGALFESATFAGEVNFERATFTHQAGFKSVTFQNSTSFGGAKFQAPANFTGIKVERAFDMTGATFAHVPAFNQADFKQAPDLDDVKFPLPGFWRGDDTSLANDLPPPWHSSNTSLIPLYRAIRRIAIQGADYEREQMAFKGETRCKRGTEHKLWHAAFWFGLAYDAFSDFGRSIARPLAIWLASAIAFAGIYLWDACEPVSEWWSACANDGATKALKALTLSAANSLPLIGSSRSEVAKEFYTSCLALPHVPAWSPLLQIWQTLWSAVLLFLFLLALRNQFKIK